MPATVVSRLKDVLDTKGWSMAHLARETGLPYITVFRYYHFDQGRMDVAVLVKLCAALDVGIGELLEYHGKSKGESD